MICDLSGKDLLHVILALTLENTDFSNWITATYQKEKSLFLMMKIQTKKPGAAFLDSDNICNLTDLHNRYS